MLLVGALAVVVMLWMASGGVGGNTQPGALIALFVFCALAAFEALAPVTGAFQHLGQVIASALHHRTDRTAARSHLPGSSIIQFLSRSLSRYAMFHSAIRGKHKKRSTPFRCRLSPVNTLRFSVALAAVSQRYYNC